MQTPPTKTVFKQLEDISAGIFVINPSGAWNQSLTGEEEIILRSGADRIGSWVELNIGWVFVRVTASYDYMKEFGAFRAVEVLRDRLFNGLMEIYSGGNAVLRRKLESTLSNAFDKNYPPCVNY